MAPTLFSTIFPPSYTHPFIYPDGNPIFIGDAQSSVLAIMRKKKSLFLDSYYDFDSIFPQEYFEISLQETANGFWLVYYENDLGETAYGPFLENELLDRLTLAPFYFEEIVFIYHLIENPDRELKNLGVRLLKSLVK